MAEEVVIDANGSAHMVNFYRSGRVIVIDAKSGADYILLTGNAEGEIVTNQLPIPLTRKASQALLDQRRRHMTLQRMVQG